MTCKDCYHSEVCYCRGVSVWRDVEQTEEDHCRHFKDKSRIVELPMPGGAEMTYEEAYDWCVQFENNVIAYSKDRTKTALALQAMQKCREVLKEKMKGVQK